MSWEVAVRGTSEKWFPTVVDNLTTSQQAALGTP